MTHYVIDPMFRKIVDDNEDKTRGQQLQEGK